MDFVPPENTPKSTRKRKKIGKKFGTGATFELNFSEEEDQHSTQSNLEAFLGLDQAGKKALIREAIRNKIIDQINQVIYGKACEREESKNASLMGENADTWNNRWKTKRLDASKTEARIRKDKLVKVKHKAELKRFMAGMKHPNKNYVSVYSKELLMSIVPYNHLLNKVEQRKYITRL
jgi:hypothetical protein